MAALLQERFEQLDVHALRSECQRQGIEIKPLARKKTCIKKLLEARASMQRDPRGGAPKRDAPPAPPTKRDTRRAWTLCPGRIRGAAFDRDDLHSLVKQLVRDSNVSTRRAAIAAAQPGPEKRPTHDYYLRARPPSDALDVDHVVECQLAAFAVVNAAETRRILAQITDASRTRQPVVVQNLCTPLYDVHNASANLRLLDKKVNVSKGAVFKGFVKELYERGAAGEEDVVRRMSRQFRNLDLPPAVDVDALAGSIGDEMARVEDAYADAIRGGALVAAAARGARRLDAEATMGAVADNVVQLYEDMGLARRR